MIIIINFKNCLPISGSGSCRPGTNDYSVTVSYAVNNKVDWHIIDKMKWAIIDTLRHYHSFSSAKSQIFFDFLVLSRHQFDSLKEGNLLFLGYIIALNAIFLIMIGGGGGGALPYLGNTVHVCATMINSFFHSYM